MNLSHTRASQPLYGVTAVLCITLLSPGASLVSAQQAAEPTPPPQVAPSAQETPAPKIPNDQLDSLVAPIALYPDPLLAQTLAASTYPLEVIQLEQWLEKNKNLKGKALADAAGKQKWDPSVQSMAVFPDAVKQLANNVAWTSDLGNAFLAQQADVMDAVQRMRAKAQAAGNLKSSQQQKVESKTVESKTVIVIEQADPQVVYVPAYNPMVVYGAPVYPYPPIVYPPGYGLLAFGAGVAIGAAWGNGGWGYGCGWGSTNNITINYNNNFVNNSNRTNVSNRPSTLPAGGSGNWQHNPEHRGNAPYGDRGTADRFGANARQQPAGGLNNRPGGGAGAGTRDLAKRDQAGGTRDLANRDQASNARRSAGGDRPSTKPATRPSGGGANRIGNQSLGGSSTFSSRGGGFGGGGGASASHASSMRGGSSMGGGGFKGGGGGARGGGGRRR